VQEALDLDVPAPVITTSLFHRYYSRGNGAFGSKVLAAMRNQFGGHAVKLESGESSGVSFGSTGGMLGSNAIGVDARIESPSVTPSTQPEVAQSIVESKGWINRRTERRIATFRALSVDIVNEAANHKGARAHHTFRRRVGFVYLLNMQILIRKFGINFLMNLLYTFGVIGILVVGGALIARRNLRLNRSDRRGAARAEPAGQASLSSNDLAARVMRSTRNINRTL